MIKVHNASRVELGDVPVVAMAEFREIILRHTARGSRIASLFGWPHAGFVRLIAVLASDTAGRLGVVASDVEGEYPALTPDCTQAYWFEREIFEQTCVTPKGHPRLTPLRFTRRRVTNDDFQRVHGEEIHEVAVGPVHAGVIEPGHFRFQCHGETVLLLEIALGFQHRGIESRLRGGPDKRTLHHIATLAGDTSVGHSTAYCQAIEVLQEAVVSPQADSIRGIALELERMANHTGDLGALAGDVGFLPTASACGRLRGEFLNLTAALCGNRFGRGLVRPGGTGWGLDRSRAARMRGRLDVAWKELEQAVALLWSTPSVLARFEDTGVLTPETAEQLGVVGPVARASGLERDVRYAFPTGVYRLAHIPIAAWPTGDVFARAQVRWLELQRSAQFVRSQLDEVRDVPPGAVAPSPMSLPMSLPPECMVVSLVEGWRGEICHTAITDAQGKLAAYKVVDPSFHNWAAMELVLRGQPISDFPLCNKSMNLSYCGHDL